MTLKKILITALLIFLLIENVFPQLYEPTWASIDKRPIPQWFQDAKFGIFIHWGVYSVPSYRPVSPRMYETYAEWYEAKVMHDDSIGAEFHDANYGKNFGYRDFAPYFKAELFDPDYWAELFKRSGAKYVVLTSKHHDGYCMWPTDITHKKDWNVGDLGPKRDLLGDLTTSVRNHGLKMGIYYSLMEWESTPRNHVWSGGLDGYYLPDSIIEKYQIPDSNYIDENMIPQLKELVLNYQPAVIFSDGEWDKPAEYWKSKEFLAWLYNNAPNKNEVVVNDRWGANTRGKHGGYYTSEYSSDDEHMSEEHPWEESRGMGQSYGFNRAENIDDYSTSEELLYQFVDIVSRGGNLLLNIGPTADGRIPVYMQSILLDIGKWLEVNGEAIYGSEAYAIPKIKEAGQTVFFTQKNKNLYAIVFNLSNMQPVLQIPGLKSPESITLLDSDAPINFKYNGDTLHFLLEGDDLLKLKQKPMVFKIKNTLN